MAMEQGGSRARDTDVTQLEAFFAEHGQPLVTRGTRMDDPCLTADATRELLALLRQLGIKPIGMEIWRWVEGDLDIDGPKTWYAQAQHSLPQVHEDAMLYVDRIHPGPDDRLTVQFE